MKTLLNTLIAVAISNLVLAQTTTENYVKNTTPQTPVQTEAALNNLSTDHKQETITYIDGLGRPKQSVAVRAGGIISQNYSIPYDWSSGTPSSSGFYNPLAGSSENSIINGDLRFLRCWVSALFAVGCVDSPHCDASFKPGHMQ